MSLDRKILESYFIPPHQKKINIDQLIKINKPENIKGFIEKKITPEIRYWLNKKMDHEYIETLHKLLIKGKYMKKKKQTYKEIMAELGSTKPKKTNEEYRLEQQAKLRKMFDSQKCDKFEKL